MSKAVAIVDALLEADELDPKEFIGQQKFRGPYQKSTDKFHNQDGTLTNYAFACGYRQRAEVAGVSLQLWKEGTWHVRATNNHTAQRLFWDCFDKKGDAVRRYNQELRRLKSLEKSGLSESEEVDPKEFLNSATRDVYYSIVFLQGEEAQEWFERMEELREDSIIELMADTYDGTDVGGEHERYLEPCWGDADDEYVGEYNGHRYVLAWNRGLGYISLNRIEREFIDHEDTE
jgi:hypothetical protein